MRKGAKDAEAELIVTAPQLPPSFSADFNEHADLSDGNVLKHLHWSNVKLFDVSARTLLFQGSILSGCGFIGADLPGLQLFDVTLKGCDLRSAILSDASLNRVAFQDCKLENLYLASAAMRDVTFVRCDLTKANFSEAHLNHVLLQNCTFAGADFDTTKFERVAFKNCDLNQAVFHRCWIDNLDFRTSKVEGMQGLGSLKKAVFSTEQLLELAPAMAAELGLEIRQ